MTSLTKEQWLQQREEHRNRLLPWVVAHRERAARGIRHPVYDFLFTYYSCSAGRILRWSPGLGVMLRDARSWETDWPRQMCDVPGGCWLDSTAFSVQRFDYLQWAIKYLETVNGREPSFHCFGLHEWAMVYRCDRVRHEKFPLRLSNEAIAAVVEEQGLRCTHFDAYRFFTPAAVLQNRIALTRAAAIDHDQGGCIHANMDLYKFAFSIAPFLPSSIVADAFEHAVAAREIDMRASPYDLRSLGFDPIPIETREGREHYVSEQKRLSARARELRQRLAGLYRLLLESLPKRIAVTER